MTIRSLAAVLALLAASALAQPLAGSYSINPTLPVTARNFTTLNAAVTALNANGVSGPVTFEIYDDGGPYAENISYTSSPTSLALLNNDCALLLNQWTGVSSTNRVVFRAAYGESPVIDATGRAVAVYWGGADYTTLEGLEIRGALLDAICMYTPSTLSALGNRIERCHIHSCGRVGILTYGNSGPVNDTVIANNLFHDLMTNSNGGGFSGFVRDGYIAGRRDNNTQILHNTFVCNTMVVPNGWILGNYPSGTYTAFSRVDGNIFVKSTALGTIFNYQTSGATVPPILPATSDRNCFHNPTASPLAVSGPLAAPAASYANLVAWQAGTGRDLASFEADPQLAAAPGFPILLPGSPCIGAAGTTVGVEVDYDRELRLGNFDIGADQTIQSSQPRMVRVGAGCASANGIAPRLFGTQFPFLGNASFAIDLADAVPNQGAFLFASLGVAAYPAPVNPGCNLYLDLASFLTFFSIGFGPFPTTTNGSGSGSFLLPIPNQGNLVGTEVGFQAAVVDPSVPGGASLSDAVLVRIG